ALTTLHAQVFNVEISTANKAHHAAVGTESFANLFIRIACQANRAVAAKFVIEEVVSEINQNAGLARVEIVTRSISQTSRVLLAHAGERCEGGLHLRRIVKRLGLSRNRVYLEQARECCSILADDEVMLAVFQPTRIRRRAAEVNASLRIENVVNGEGLVLSQANRGGENNQSKRLN